MQESRIIEKEVELQEFEIHEMQLQNESLL